MKRFLDIPGSKDWRSVDPVNRGWPSDARYLITTGDGRQLLLWVSDVSLLERKQDEYEAMTMLDQAHAASHWYDGFRSCIPDWYVADSEE